jgi:ABC-type multidrug transport system ATPase subunit
MLQSLGLYETKDLKVGSPLEKTISGGQRKRLNIALELIREPSVLFVDEPTSGLSSRDSENIMDLLKELALQRQAGLRGDPPTVIGHLQALRSAVAHGSGRPPGLLR